MDDQNLPSQCVDGESVDGVDENFCGHENLIEIIRNHPSIWDPVPGDVSTTEEAWHTVCRLIHANYDNCDDYKQKQISFKIRNKWDKQVLDYQKVLKKWLKANNIGKPSQNGTCLKKPFKSKHVELFSFLYSKQNAEEDDPFVQYGKFLMETSDVSSADCIHTSPLHLNLYTLIEHVGNHRPIWDIKGVYPYISRESRIAQNKAWDSVVRLMYPPLSAEQHDELVQKLRVKWKSILNLEREYLRKVLAGSNPCKTRYTDKLAFLLTKQIASPDDDIFTYYAKYVSDPSMKGSFLNSKHNAEEDDTMVLHGQFLKQSVDSSALHFDVNTFIEHIGNHRPIWDTDGIYPYLSKDSRAAKANAWDSLVRLMYPVDSLSTDEQQGLVKQLRERWKTIYHRERDYVKKVLAGLKPNPTKFTDKLTFLFTKQSASKDDIFCEYARLYGKNNANQGTIAYERPQPQVTQPQTPSPQPQPTSNVPQFDFVPVNTFVKPEEEKLTSAAVFESMVVDPVATMLSSPGDLTVDNAFAFSLMHDYKALTEKQKNKFKILTLQFFLEAQEERERAQNPM